MSNRNLVLSLLVLFFSACNGPAPKVLEVMSEAKSDEIQIEEVESMVNKTVGYINSRDIDSLFTCVDKDGFSSFILNGNMFSNYHTAYTGMKFGYKKYKSVKVSLRFEKIELLSPETAMFNAQFKETIVDKDNVANDYNGAMTSILKRVNGEWKYIHVHQSYYPVNK